MKKDHGDDLYKYPQKIRSNFSSNVMPGVDLEPLIEHLRKKISVIGHYPEPEPISLENVLAAHIKIPYASVCVTAGSTEMIYLLAQVFSGSNTAILQPTFSEYEEACRIHGHKIRFIYTLEQLTEDCDTVWICNPNNPSGRVIPIEKLKKAISKYPQTMFFLDLAYEAFTHEVLFEESDVLEYPNLILIYSMTKKYAIPGLRLGYTVACPSIIQKIRAYRMPWTVSALASEAALFLIQNERIIQEGIHSLLKESEYLQNKLSQLSNLEVMPTNTHFMLIKLKEGRATALKAYLINQYGVLIRDASGYPGLNEHYFRISTQTRAENDALIKAIETWQPC